MSDETPVINGKLTVPDEADEYRFYCADQCGRMGFELEGVQAIVVAELTKLVDEAFPDDSVDYHYALEGLLEATQSRITELSREGE